MNRQNSGMNRVERALKAAYLSREQEARAGGHDVGQPARIMARIRTISRERRIGMLGDTRFLWRFVSAGAIAAAALVLIAVMDVPQDAQNLGLNQDDVVSLVLNPTMPF